MSKLQIISFLSGQYRLHGVLHLPEIRNPPVVIGCHGLLANCNSPKQIALAQNCVDSGIAYFRFDHRGCGQSQGEFEKVTTLSSRCDDLKRAIEIITARVGGNRPVGLFGSSIGGAVSLAVAGEMETGPKVVVAAPLCTRNLHHPLQPDPAGSQPISDRFYRNSSAFDLHDMLDKINNILIFHGDMDTVVPVSNAHKLYALSGSPKKLMIQKEGDHRMSDRHHQQQFQAEALQWFQNGFGLA